MSHHNENFESSPAMLHFLEEDQELLKGQAKFIVKGQGVIALENPLKTDFFIKISQGYESLILRVSHSTGLEVVKSIDSIEKHLFSNHDIHIDPDPEACYWYSLDGLNRVLKFGIGEVRNGLTLFNEIIDLPWLEDVESCEFSLDLIPIEIYRDPITVDPPLRVVPSDFVSIEDVAENRYLVSANLNASCQSLYANISGTNFKLNTPDFPDFTEAIEASIRSENGWCNQVLKSKATEFGGDDILETYLRITLGVNQGDSPGIPYVIEIWPPNHFSPIHKHGNANAVIRVLHGEITVNLYPMLSKYHEVPFAIDTFKKDEVTWISPRYNQVHKLHNTNLSGPSCITIQCYQYGDDNTVHYPYFDYINEKEQIEQFVPNSDAGYMEFKAIIRKEWDSKSTR